MEKLLIFTNHVSLGIVYHEFTEKILKQIEISMCSPIYSFKDGNLTQVDNLQSGDIFLIWDEMSQDDYDGLINGGTIDKYFILYHEKMNENVSLFNIEFTKHNEFALKGQHISNSATPYYEVLEILSDDQENKKRRIIDLIFKYKLNAALDFLHCCLKGKPEELDILTDAGIDVEKKCDSGEMNGKTIKVLYNQLPEYEFRNNEKDYFAALKKLRDAVLEQAGISL